MFVNYAQQLGLGAFDPIGKGQQYQQNAQNMRFNEQTMDMRGLQHEQDQIAADKQRIVDENIGLARQGDPNAMGKVFEANPQLGQFFEQRQAEKIAKFGAERAQTINKKTTAFMLELRNTPPEKRPDLLNRAITDDDIDFDDVDMHEQVLAGDNELINYTLYGLMGKDAYSALNQSQEKTTWQKDFDAKTQYLSDEDKIRAARIDAGLDPRAGVISSDQRQATDQGLGDAVIDYKTQEAKSVEQTKADIKTAAEGRSAAIKAAVGKGAAQYDKIPNIVSTMRNYDAAISELDAGADTGTIYSMLPSINAASKRLDNIIKNLGLNVVGSTTFGALSESELNFALRAAIPDNLSPDELREWLVDKRDAQTKILAGIEEFVSFVGGGEKTLADWQNREARRSIRSKSTSSNQDASSKLTTPIDIQSFDPSTASEAELDAFLKQNESIDI